MVFGLQQRDSRYQDSQAGVVERGHFARMARRMALANGDPQPATEMADEASSPRRTLRDPEVECLGPLYPTAATR